MTKLDQAVRFGAWAQRLGYVPSIPEIKSEFPNMCRATVYRWRRTLLRAWGLPTQGRGERLRTGCAPREAA